MLNPIFVAQWSPSLPRRIAAKKVAAKLEYEIGTSIYLP
jgi:hypothetical protein